MRVNKEISMDHMKLLKVKVKALTWPLTWMLIPLRPSGRAVIQ